MLKFAIIVASQSEECEVVVPANIWKRSGAIVKLITIEKKKNVILSKGLKVSCDALLIKENLSKYNMIYLPGGQGYKKFTDAIAPKLTSYIRMHAQDKNIKFLGLCAGPTVYKSLGVIGKNTKLSAYPEFAQMLGANYSRDRVTVSGNFITGAGPLVAAEFAFKVIEVCDSPGKAKNIQKEMLYK